jgi:integrase
MGVYQRGKSWYYDFYYEGKRYKESCGAVNKTIAKEIETVKKREVIQGVYKPKAVKILFKDFAPKYLENARLNKKHKSALRNEVSIKMLMPHFGGCSLDKINTFMVEQYKKVRKDEGRAPATINRDIATLRNILNKAVEWKYLKDNPLRGYKLLKEQNEKMWALTHEEESRLLQACDNTQQTEKYLSDMVSFALHSGMRLEEIRSLKKTDVDIKARFIVVTNTKNSEQRKVPINETLLEIIKRRMQRKFTDYIFCDAKGNKLTVLTNAFWTAVANAGLKRNEDVRGELKEVRFRFHDLRHTFGSRLGMAGVDVKTIMEIMGHKTYRMALRYQHPAPDHKQRAVNFLDQITRDITREGNDTANNIYKTVR